MAWGFDVNSLFTANGTTAVPPNVLAKLACHYATYLITQNATKIEDDPFFAKVDAILFNLRNKDKFCEFAHYPFWRASHNDRVAELLSGTVVHKSLSYHYAMERIPAKQSMLPEMVACQAGRPLFRAQAVQGEVNISKFLPLRPRVKFLEHMKAAHRAAFFPYLDLLHKIKQELADENRPVDQDSEGSESSSSSSWCSLM